MSITSTSILGPVTVQVARVTATFPGGSETIAGRDWTELRGESITSNRRSGDVTGATNDAARDGVGVCTRMLGTSAIRKQHPARSNVSSKSIRRGRAQVVTTALAVTRATVYSANAVIAGSRCVWRLLCCESDSSLVYRGRRYNGALDNNTRRLCSPSYMHPVDAKLSNFT